MRLFYSWMTKADMITTHWMARYGVVLLRMTLGVIFFWFGALKLLPDVSPAQALATKTIALLTYGLIPADVSIYLLAMWECLVGIGLIWGIMLRAVILLCLSH